MELKNIVLLSTLSTIPIGYLIGVNTRQYRDARDWIETHNMDISYYKEKIKKQKDESFKDKIDYYLGYLGRNIAFKKLRN